MAIPIFRENLKFSEKVSPYILTNELFAGVLQGLPANFE